VVSYRFEPLWKTLAFDDAPRGWRGVCDKAWLITFTPWRFG
jgi:hypothetical protein